MSKKMAEGIDALVLDVKTGDGAFMASEETRARWRGDARHRARDGQKIVALITDMDQPLGRTVGNALEIAESIESCRARARRTWRRSPSSWRPGC